MFHMVAVMEEEVALTHTELLPQDSVLAAEEEEEEVGIEGALEARGRHKRKRRSFKKP